MFHLFVALFCCYYFHLFVQCAGQSSTDVIRIKHLPEVQILVGSNGYLYDKSEHNLTCYVSGYTVMNVQWLYDGNVLENDTIENVFIFQQSSRLFINKHKDNNHVNGQFECNAQLMDIGVVRSLPFTFLIAGFEEQDKDKMIPNYDKLSVPGGSNVFIPCHVPQSIPQSRPQWKLISKTGANELEKHDKITYLFDGIIIEKVSIFDGGDYNCTIKNDITHEKISSNRPFKLGIQDGNNIAGFSYPISDITSVQVPIGGNFTLRCISYGSKHFWTKPGVTIPERHQSKLERFNVSPNDAGRYQCTINEVVKSYEVVVIDNLKVTIQKTNDKQLTCSVKNSETNAKMDWYVNGKSIDDIELDIFINKKPSTDFEFDDYEYDSAAVVEELIFKSNPTSGVYQCIVSDPVKRMASSSVYVNVLPAAIKHVEPNLIFKHSTGLNPRHASCKAYNANSIKWQIDDKPPIETNSSLSENNLVSNIIYWQVGKVKVKRVTCIASYSDGISTNSSRSAPAINNINLPIRPVKVSHSGSCKLRSNTFKLIQINSNQVNIKPKPMNIENQLNKCRSHKLNIKQCKLVKVQQLIPNVYTKTQELDNVQLFNMDSVNLDIAHDELNSNYSFNLVLNCPVKDNDLLTVQVRSGLNSLVWNYDNQSGVPVVNVILTRLQRINSTVVVDWKCNKCKPDGSVQISGFWVNYVATNSAGHNTKEILIDKRKRRAKLPELSLGTEYTFWIVPFNSLGKGSRSNRMTLTRNNSVHVNQYRLNATTVKSVKVDIDSTIKPFMMTSLSTNHLLIIIGGVLAGLLIILIVVVIVCILNQTRQHKSLEEAQTRDQFETHQMLNGREMTLYQNPMDSLPVGCGDPRMQHDQNHCDEFGAGSADSVEQNGSAPECDKISSMNNINSSLNDDSLHNHYAPPISLREVNSASPYDYVSSSDCGPMLNAMTFGPTGISSNCSGIPFMTHLNTIDNRPIPMTQLCHSPPDYNHQFGLNNYYYPGIPQINGASRNYSPRPPRKAAPPNPAAQEESRLQSEYVSPKYLNQINGTSSLSTFKPHIVAPFDSN